MTDTTVPETITQAEREAAHQFMLDEWPSWDADHQTVSAALMVLLARHRRLHGSSQGAGKGLRKAEQHAIRKAREEGASDDDIVTHRLAHDYLRAALATTDAGSTTRSGGEGLDSAVAPFVADYEFRFDDGGGYTPGDHERAMLEDALYGFIAEHALATTPSPDASPDSGGALTRIISQNGPVVIDHMGEDLAWRPLDHGTWTPFTASPASLSGGAENVWRIAASIYAEVADEPLGDLSQRRQAVQDRWVDAVRGALSSPEAPVNRQEAGEVERLREALRPLADHADAAERLAGHDGPLGEWVPYETLRRARAALSPDNGEGEER